MHKAIFSADFETQNVILKTKRRGVIFKTKYNEKKDVCVSKLAILETQGQTE